MITKERLQIFTIVVFTRKLIRTAKVSITLGKGMKIYREILKIDFWIHTETPHFHQGFHWFKNGSISDRTSISFGMGNPVSHSSYI